MALRTEPKRLYNNVPQATEAKQSAAEVVLDKQHQRRHLRDETRVA